MNIKDTSANGKPSVLKYTPVDIDSQEFSCSTSHQ